MKSAIILCKLDNMAQRAVAQTFEVFISVKHIYLSACLLGFLAIPSFAWISSDPTLTNDVFQSFGPFEINMSSVSLSPATTIYDYSIDALVSDFDAEVSSAAQIGGDTLELSVGYFNFSDFQGEAIPQFIAWAHTPYFVNVPSRGNVIFRTYNINVNKSPVASGYPKVVYWKQDESARSTLILAKAGQDSTGDLYQNEASLPCGKFNYQYIIKALLYQDEYSLAVSSFVVCDAPNGFTNGGATADNAVTTNGKVRLTWNMQDPAGTPLTYKVYAGKDANNLRLVYSGTNSSCDLTMLDYGAQYYWQVEGTNLYGVASRGVVNRFSTIAEVAKAYNYPNPFNPATGENTNIVFDMRESGGAELFVYSAMGDLCWHQSFSGLPSGNNQASYNGRDDNGKMMYNGTYVCFIKKHYNSGASDTTKCRLLIIK